MDKRCLILSLRLRNMEKVSNILAFTSNLFEVRAENFLIPNKNFSPLERCHLLRCW